MYKYKRVMHPETINGHVNYYIAVPDKEKLNLEEFKTELNMIAEGFKKKENYHSLLNER